MKRKFTKLAAAFALLAALCVPLGMWGQGDYSNDYTGNVTLSTSGGTNASACKISINNTQYDGIKAGTNKNAGAVAITVPSGTKYLHLHLAGWNGESVTLTVTPSGYSGTISLTANSGIANSSPFTWGTTTNDKAPNSDFHYKVITFSNPLSQATQLTFTATSGKRFVVWGVTSEEEGGSSLEQSDLALTGAPIALSFDLYDNYDAQVVNYTTSSTGAVTVNAGSFVSISVNETEKTITVTPSAVTNGPQTITVNQAADANYAAGSVSFTVDIADSTPITSGDVTFDAEVDMGTSPLIKGGVTFECTSGVLNNGSEYRLYKNSVTTFSVSQGTITQIAFTCTSDNPASGFANQTGWTTDGNNGTWTGNANSVSFTASGAQVRATVIVVTIDAGGAPTPSFTITNNNGLAYDATEGSFDFTVNNAVTGGTTNVAEDVDWISNAVVSGNAVTFTTTANDAAASREGVITLTYTYSRETITENVTVSQAGNPTAPVNISSINAAGNYTVQGTIVAISNRGFVLGDGTGYVYYYKGNDFNPASFAIGDMKKLSGPVSASSSYKVYQFGGDTEITTATSSNYEAEDPTIISGSEMDARVGASTCTLSSFVQYEGVMTISSSNGNTYYNITSITGAQTAKGSISYPLNTEFTSLDGKQVKVTGYYVGVSTNQYYNTMIGSIEEVTTPVIIANNVTLEYDATEGEIGYEISNPTGATLTATTDSEWLSVGAVNNTAVALSCSANEGNTDRTATVTLSYAGAANKTVTVTQRHYVADFATLPFNWAGGTSAALEDLAGVTVNCDPSDYAASNAPYRVKFNEDGHCILIKTNEQPAVVSVGIKKYATGNTASLTIEGSSDGVTFTEVQSFSITGAQNAVFTYITTNAFATTDRYVRIYYNKPDGGSNVGVGPIIIRGIESYPLTIDGYADVTEGNNNKGYYLIASPVTVDLTNHDMTDGDFDLYYFDNSQDLEWRNYEATSFNLEPGKGYLYAKKATTENPTYSFELVGTPYNGDGEFELTQGTGDFADWNLVGNPFNVAAEISMDYYEMNETGSGLIAGTDYVIDVMQGVFVQYSEGDETVIFMPAETGTNSGEGSKLVVNLGRQGTAVDRAIVRFGEGRQLPKFQLFENNTKIYVTEGNKDYAVVRSAAEAEMPVSFRASENGTYTLAVEAENVEMNYLHLIDNLTGMDVDLLQTPSYTFEAKTSDYASRFRLVFKASSTSSEADETFAYFNGSSWTVSNVGDATLQVVDVTGRTVKSEQISGNATVSLNQPAGVYMMRLVNGNSVKVQKVVVR